MDQRRYEAETKPSSSR
ncbi:BnaA10g10750D [Brassica napus]|uniref:BnaA10g10750D protein n=1 Tax=Brassica napus TaxID=3708 RepID=A0A078H5N4_BRANA|nr:BnaA10g10750D [Brassica napus]